jgi:hypothetical protein
MATIDLDYISGAVPHPNKATALIAKSIKRRDVSYAEARCHFLELPIYLKRFRCKAK